MCDDKLVFADFECISLTVKKQNALEVDPAALEFGMTVNMVGDIRYVHPLDQTKVKSGFGMMD